MCWGWAGGVVDVDLVWGREDLIVSNRLFKDAGNKGKEKGSERYKIPGMG